MGARPLKAPPPPPDLATYRARLVAHGFDTYAEAYNRSFTPEARRALSEAKSAAETADARGSDPALVRLAGREFQVMPHGAAGGVRYVLRDPTAIIHVRAEGCDWGISVRYLSAGLWGNGGLVERRREIEEWLDANCEHEEENDREPVLSRFDYAFDFLAPDFTREISPALIRDFAQPAHTKAALWEQHGQTQTITLGMMPRLQVQVYDKGTELVQASGKDWFRDVWASGDHLAWPKGKPDAVASAEAANPFLAAPLDIPAAGPLEHLWRIELRYGGEYLKERGVRGYPAMCGRLHELLASALIDRRLTRGEGTRRDLRPIHPMWWWCHQAAGAATTAPRVIAYSTLQREEHRIQTLAQLAGTLRSASVAQSGKWSVEEARTLAAEAVERALLDPKGREKEIRAQARYRNMGRLY